MQREEESILRQTLQEDYIFFDYRVPSIVVDIQEYRNGYIDTTKRIGLSEK